MKRYFDYNAVISNNANISLQLILVRLPLFLFSFKVLLDFCFHFSLRVQKAAKASQPLKRVFSDKLQQHDYLHLKRKKTQSGFYFTQVPTKKIPSLFPSSCTRSPPPLNICPMVTSPLQAAQCNMSHLSTHI